MSELEFITDIEHIQKRPTMYIGPTINPDHLAQEVLDNSLDECLNGFALSVSVDIDNSTNTVIIQDNGRGIPSHDVTLPETNEVVNSIIGACTKLHSSGKFNNNTYKKSIGTFGIGLTAVNALSQTFSIATKNNKIIEHYIFKNSKYVDSKFYNKDTYKIAFSTRVEFIPDQKYFETVNFTISKFKDKLLLVKSLYPKINLYLNGEEIPYISLKDYSIKIMGINNIVDNQIIHLQDTIQDFEINTFITYDLEGSIPVQNFGAVNLHSCDGLYQTNLNTMFIKVVNDILPEKLTKSEILSKSRFYSNIIMTNPVFGSQNKVEMLTNITNYLDNLKDQLKKKLTANLFFTEWFKTILAEKKAALISKKARKSSKRVGADNPLKDCMKSPGEILYIVEGDSALGTLDDIRDNMTEAVYPLSGKILNTITATTERAINSEKMKYFFESIGIDFNTNKYRYDKYKILTDADSDGLHIAVLIELAIWKYAPDLIRQGRLLLILPPLFGTWINKKFIPLYTELEANKYKQQNYEITRYKGLGEMDANELEPVIRTPLEYIIKPPLNDKEEKSIIACINETAVKQALHDNIKLFNINNIINMCSN